MEPTQTETQTPEPEHSRSVVASALLHDNIHVAMSHCGLNPESLFARTAHIRADRIARAMAGLPTRNAPLDAIGEVVGVSRIDLVLMPTAKLNRQLQGRWWHMLARTLRPRGQK